MSKHHILVVDDESTNLHIMRQILKDDYDLSFVKTGHEAIKQAEKLVPNLILLDLMLPDIDGLEVCRRLKASPHTESIPVIFITSMDDGADEALAFQAGAVDYITKPVSRAVVLARVNTHLALANTAFLQRGYLELIHRSSDSVAITDKMTAERSTYMQHKIEQFVYAARLSEELMGPLLTAINVFFDSNSKISDTSHEAAFQALQGINEKWDGRGGPKGLKGSDIPLAARIAAVAKAVNVLCTLSIDNRLLSDEQLLNILQQGAGVYYDPELIDLFESVLAADINHTPVNPHPLH